MNLLNACKLDTFHHNDDRPVNLFLLVKTGRKRKTVSSRIHRGRSYSNLTYSLLFFSAELALFLGVDMFEEGVRLNASSGREMPEVKNEVK